MDKVDWVYWWLDLNEQDALYVETYRREQFRFPFLVLEGSSLFPDRGFNVKIFVFILIVFCFSSNAIKLLGKLFGILVTVTWSNRVATNLIQQTLKLSCRLSFLPSCARSPDTSITNFYRSTSTKGSYLRLLVWSLPLATGSPLGSKSET